MCLYCETNFSSTDVSVLNLLALWKQQVIRDLDGSSPVVLYKILFCVLGGSMLLRHFAYLDNVELGQLSRFFGSVYRCQQVLEVAKAFFEGGF